ncbi:hypothetical protein [Perlucidibaca piscinae]|uniref:hypothetical protein n=1 Tax=Perlucidibaca piscinae TaxID=392589 RepID=UPI0003B6254E|nr:hypothetical protein [Perlucidibaca piscinae]
MAQYTAPGASAPSLLSRLIAAYHRRHAVAALLVSRQRASIRLARYNAHMAAARRLAVRHD